MSIQLLLVDTRKCEGSAVSVLVLVLHRFYTSAQCVLGNPCSRFPFRDTREHRIIEQRSTIMIGPLRRRPRED